MVLFPVRCRAALGPGHCEGMLSVVSSIAGLSPRHIPSGVMRLPCNASISFMSYVDVVSDCGRLAHGQNRLTVVSLSAVDILVSWV